jgi:hypothetical protein
MPKFDLPTLIVAGLLLLVTGVGVYVTFFRQTAELERLEKAEEVVEMKKAEMEDLLEEFGQSKARARKVMSQWNSRYKVVPDTLGSPEVVGYLNDLTRSGFETFDISIQGIEKSDAYSHYTLRATGRGYFANLYRFIWQIENNRQFYSVEDLNLNHIDLITEDKETEKKKLQVMVSFNMSIEAYFGGPKGLAASGSEWRPVSEDGTPQPRSASLPPVPSKVLADANPNINPFFPVIMDQLPPNTRGLVNVDEAQLVSIVGGEAVFKDNEGLRKVGVGDDVYLGQITKINATEGRVKAILNRGGIIDDVEVTLGGEDAYRGVTGTSSYTPPRQSRTRVNRSGASSGDGPSGSRAREMGSNSQGRMSQGRTSNGRISGRRNSSRSGGGNESGGGNQ